MNDWQPSATLITLHQRAALLRRIREFFYLRHFLEVETPILSHSSVTDVYLASFTSQLSHDTLYLQTSPEYHMKRLLAAGSGPIFQLSKSFRKDEQGRLHNPEFTMLEWYRPGFNHHALMDEMQEFLQTILQCSSVDRMSYADMFLKYLHFNPHQATIADVQQLAVQLEMGNLDLGDDKDPWLQVLMLHFIEPQLGAAQPIMIYDFPASQAALAKIRKDNDHLAERFEVYYRGIELANGFHELTDHEEQRQRFFNDLAKRRELGLPDIPLDPHFLAALSHGLPACSGVAVGIDRLIMLALQKSSIAEVISFTYDHA